MTGIAIAALPSYAGASPAAGVLMPIVDPADTSASPAGTTKRLSASQMLSNLPWANVTGRPTTLSGYGITDAASANGPFPWAGVTGHPTTIAGYGITDAYTMTASDARYAPIGGPFPWAAVTGHPTTLAGYGITDAVQSPITAPMVGAGTYPAGAFTYPGILTSNTALSLTGNASNGALALQGGFGLMVVGNTGISSDFSLWMPGMAGVVMQVPTGTTNVIFGGQVSVGGSATTTFGLRVYAPANSYYARIWLANGTSAGSWPNWEIAQSNVTLGTLEITQSTVANGTAFTTPTLTLYGPGPASPPNGTELRLHQGSATDNVQYGIFDFSGNRVGRIYWNGGAAAGTRYLAFFGGPSADYVVLGSQNNVRTETWVNGAAVTTVNSVGLGIGGAPGYPLDIFTAGGGYALRTQHSHPTTPYGISLNFTGGAPNNATTQFLICFDTSAQRAAIYGNGGLANFQTNNVNLSDAALKEVGDEIDAAEWYDRLAKIPIRHFKYLDQTHDDWNIGLIAQDVEAVAPELCEEMEFGAERMVKMVYTTDLYHAHIAVTQELQRRLAALEAIVTPPKAAKKAANKKNHHG